MEYVYHIVTIRVNETSWAHVWRLRSHYLGMGFDTNAAPLLLPHVCKRWEALAAAAALLPHARRRHHRMTKWRCGWSAAPLLLYAWGLLLLRHACWLLLLRQQQHPLRWLCHPMNPPRTPRATMMIAHTSNMWAHIYELLLDFNC
jgi:hypothetical protein